ncbi:hypothetical protein LTR15_009730 [Elasticomyces elasticus]|nr:hypothetical protein LTR15_009730 [Elasticomyces elasticus]
MFNAVISLLGLRGRNPADIEASSPTTQRTRRPYGGQPVPLDASQDPTDSDFYDEWFEAINIVPASDGVSFLTFCPGFLSEDPDTHEVDYDEEMYPRDEDINWVRRLRDTNRVYQHMFESESESTSSSHPRIVR